MNLDVPPHSYRLPLGFSVRFSIVAGHLEVQWEPDIPTPTTIPSLRHRKKLFRAYQAARREFMQTVASLIGGSVLVVDTDDFAGDGGPIGEVVEPPHKH